MFVEANHAQMSMAVWAARMQVTVISGVLQVMKITMKMMVKVAM